MFYQDKIFEQYTDLSHQRTQYFYNEGDDSNSINMPVGFNNIIAKQK